MKRKRSLSILLTVAMVLSLPLFLPVPKPVDGSTVTTFYYQHDPRLNADAMKDIIVNPEAVYGFSPDPDGSLAAYAALDWSDRSKVDGEEGRLARIAYHQSIQEMYNLLEQMKKDGRSSEEIARAVSVKRNELRLASYTNQDQLALVKARNLEEYGHEEGPLPEELYEKYGTWEKVIEKSFKVNAGMDACLGLYDDYYDLYQVTGQVTDEKKTAATREYTVASFTDAEGLPALSPDNMEESLSRFTDANTISTWYRSEMATAVSADLVRGYTDRTLLPQNPIRRVEAFVLLSRCLKNTRETAEAISFTDVPDWAQADIDRLSKAGLIQGYGNGILGSNDLLTVEQVGILVKRIRTSASSPADPLSLWTEDATAKKELMSFIEATTDENSQDYIPVEDRIAVFDLDGTLFCETDPVYFDYCLLRYRVTEDPDYKDRATDFEKEVAVKIDQYIATGSSPEGLEVDHGKAVASAFSGMSVNEFEAYVTSFKKQKAPGYEGMTRGEAFYRPMVEIVNYLKANDFTVYIVSGTDRLIVRGIVRDSALNIPKRQIIGSDETIVSNNQKDTDGLDYVFKDGEKLILGGQFLIKNLKMNKVSVIMQEIGQQPVLSFGNSTGDSSMAEYVTSNNPYRSLAFMLCCDDTVRENGDTAKADKMLSLCREFDWIPVSMKNDWTTIYGDEVTRKGSKDIREAA